MPRIYDVYGSVEPELGSKPIQLAEALHVVWEERHSDFRGRYFQAPGPSAAGGRLILQANDLSDGTGEYLQLPDFPDCRYLLFANELAEPDVIRARLAQMPQWRFLRRRELD